MLVGTMIYTHGKTADRQELLTGNDLAG